jgi:hypothetical protein
MSATREVDAAPSRDGMGGRIVVGQIHSQDDESVNFQDSGGKNTGLAQVLRIFNLRTMQYRGD